MSSFMQHLSARLSHGEACLVHGDARAASEVATDVLRDLASLYSTRGRLLTRPHHACTDGCVCEAAVILSMQCATDLRASESDMRDLVEAHFERTPHMPHPVFHTWLEYHLSNQRYELCCQELVAYIDVHFNASTLSATSSGPHDAAMAETNARYQQLLEVLIFDVLVPLRSYDEAIVFLKKGKKSRPGQPPAERDERIPQEVKEDWIHSLIELKSLRVSHALAATESAQRWLADDETDGAFMNEPPVGRLLSADAHSSNTADASPSTSYHAGLASLLGTTTFFTRLPAAQLPVPGAETTSDHVSLPDEHVDADDESDLGAAAHHRASSSSSQLIPYPPLDPLVPSLTTPSFTLSSYLRSLGHRVYALLHAHWPALANRLRICASWAWQRRSFVTALMALYVAYRLANLLVTYFRLASLPGVALLLNELRNFLKIAFISGTGQSLFG